MKDNVDDLLNLTKQIEKGVKQTINYMTLLSTAELICVNIKNRAKNGLGVRQVGDTDSSLKPLRESTIKLRRKLQEKGKLSSDTQPEFSNQIESGEMVNSIRVEYNKNEIEIGVFEKANIDKIISNEEKDRIILQLSKEDVELIDNRVSDLIDDLLKNL